MSRSSQREAPKSATPKTPASDAFSFAVLLFQLLFDGPHPFSGVFRGAGPCPTPAEALLAGDYVFAEGSRLSPRLGMPGLGAVHPSLAHAFERTFVAGLHRPELRTSVKTWAELLERAELSLVRCARNRAHLHPSVAPGCAYCARAESFGRAFETFAQVNTEDLPPATKPSVPPAKVAAEPALERTREPTPSTSADAVDEASAALPRPAHRRRATWTAGRRRARRQEPKASDEKTLAGPAIDAVAPEATTEPQAFPVTEAAMAHAAKRTAAPHVEANPAPPRKRATGATPPTETARRAASPAAPPRVEHLRMPRYAVLAVALAAFALGRCTGAPTTTHEEAALHEAPSAPQTTGMRSSSVVRREGPTAEKKTPRPPR